MSYAGSVTIVDGLVPVNSQDFPLVNARHVYVDDNTRLSDFVETVTGQIDDINYIPIAINSLSITTPTSGIAEIGSTISSITYSYSCSKKPDTLTFNGTSISTPAASGSGLTLSGLSVTANRSFTMQATDHGSNSNPSLTVTRSVSLYFYNKIHWGVAAAPASYNNAFLLTTLGNHELASSKAKTFTVNAGSEQYIFFALPTSMGTPTFKVGGFDGGFTKAAEFSHTNASGGTATYAVYKSDNANLGSTTVVVS